MGWEWFAFALGRGHGCIAVVGASPSLVSRQRWEDEGAAVAIVVSEGEDTEVLLCQWRRRMDGEGTWTRTRQERGKRATARCRVGGNERVGREHERERGCVVGTVVRTRGGGMGEGATSL